MHSVLQAFPHLLQASVVIVGIGSVALVALALRALMSLPRPRPVYVSIHDLLGERR